MRALLDENVLIALNDVNRLSNSSMPELSIKLTGAWFSLSSVTLLGILTDRVILAGVVPS